MRRRRAPSGLVLLVVVVLVLGSSCGNGGSSGPTPDAPATGGVDGPPGAADAPAGGSPDATGGLPAGDYLIGQAGSIVINGTIQFAGITQPNGSMDLVAVLPALPTRSLVLERAGQWFATGTKSFGAVLEGVVDANAHTHASLRQRFTVYEKVDHLMKIDQHASAGGPVATRWSTLTTPEICPQSSFLGSMANDYVDPTRSYFFFKTPATPGTDCDILDDKTLAVRLDMGAADAPLPVASPLATIYDASGAIDGFLVVDAGRFVRVDADFANPQDLFAAPSFPLAVGVFGTTPPGIFIYLFEGNIFAVDLANPTGATMLAPTVSDSGVPLIQNLDSDGGSLYFALGRQVVRIDENGTATTVGTAGDTIDGLSLTPTRVVLKVGSSTLASLAKSGVDATPGTLASLPAGRTFVLMSGFGRTTSLQSPLWNRAFLVGGENVYYTTADNNGATVYRVNVIGADGSSPLELIDSAVVKWTSPPALPWSVNGAADRLFIASNQGVHLFADSPVVVYDAASRAQLSTLGMLPDGIVISTLDLCVDPLQTGQPGLVNVLGPGVQNLGVFTSDAAGLTVATAY